LWLIEELLLELKEKEVVVDELKLMGMITV
jgi:hypothetical protein